MGWVVRGVGHRGDGGKCSCLRIRRDKRGAGFEVPCACWLGKRVAVEVSLIQIECMI